MKSKLITFLFLIFLLLSFSAKSQSLVVQGVGSFNLLYEFETGFLGGGLGIEGKMGRFFSLGIDGTYGVSDDLRLFNLSPSVKFYPAASLKGFFVGAGFGIFQLSSRDDKPIGFPLEDEQASSDTIFGPKVFIGFQTLVKDKITIGFETGLGALPQTDSGFLNIQCRVGYAF